MPCFARRPFKYSLIFGVCGIAVTVTVVAQRAADPNRVFIASVVGCLVEEPAHNWRLQSATVPVESTFQLSDVAEVRKAETIPLGDLSYRLVGARFFKPDAYKGFKVLVKGALVKSEKDVAVNVTSLQMANAVCAK